MAIRTFDLMVGDMLLMHKLRGVFGCQDVRFIMALDAFPLRDTAVSLNHIDMASLTLHPSCNIFPMVEIPVFDLNIPLRLYMAGDTTSHSTGDALLLTLRACSKVMADETVDLVDSQMGALDKLGMATGAPEFHPSSQLLEMFSVRKDHILINHILLQVLNLMASLLKATGVTDLRMGFTGSLAREKIGEGNLAIHPLPLQMIEQARLVMALRTGHMAMAGGSPRLHINIHLVTESAEGRTFSKPENSERKNEKEDNTDDQRGFDGPAMFLSPLLKTEINIDPEVPDELIGLFNVFKSIEILISAQRRRKFKFFHRSPTPFD